MSTILCQRCGKRPASVHLTEIEGTTRREVHLCENCGNETGVAKPGISLELLQTLLNPIGGREAGELGRLKCETCGTTYAEFRARGRFGCPDDYLAFQKPLEALIEKIHGATRHVGKVPSGTVAAPAAAAAPAPAPAVATPAMVATPDAQNAERATQNAPPVPAPAAPPAPAPAPPSGTMKLKELRAQLAQAIGAESYERAAELRDAIRALEEPGGSR